MCESAIMSAIEVQYFLGRARDFLEGMKLLQDDLAQYRYSSALLGIHGALSFGDALRIGMGSAKVSSDNHLDALSDLKSMLATRKFEKPQGADSLGRLLSKKTRVAYIAEAASENEIKDIVVQAERFASWAEEGGKKLQIEGW
jgi:hypothetical protein